MLFGLLRPVTRSASTVVRSIYTTRSTALQSSRRTYATPSSAKLAGGTSGLTTPITIVLALGGGAFLYTAYVKEEELIHPHLPSKDIMEMTQSEQVDLVKHWKAGHEKRVALERAHKAALDKELARIEEAHPGALERRKECEERRAKIKAHEVMLMQHRHAEGCPHMGGKMQSWAERKRAQAAEDIKTDSKMEALQKKLEEQGVKF
ncbi:BZ3500_MvSof-1268-A1-R1_Chr9g10729 [Microbotryum saponariae]|uniref:BZ3500_MvSof-1268-A1-R1_Chr9g10729 protein n=1 Tax=Microbotryum saponariae TaxID=289078 RepID=A0A2X0KBF2_9BASI|nr:BZ3501_MvSof-1269-A2-R1_Chr9g10477 [Microbotryum saponariae]SDA00596.1 BZ3500_MvSof-1268-A1-R1_Chr9g10729 [Microbotryum saponariae]